LPHGWLAVGYKMPLVSPIGSTRRLRTCGFAACCAERLRLSVAADYP